MTVLCPSCARRIVVPPDKAALPGLRARCAGCQTVFAVAEASIAPAAPAPPAAQPVAAAPAAGTVATAPARAVAPASAGASAGARPLPRPRGWRRCANHPAVASEAVCPQCGRGLCGACLKRQGQASICPECDALCVPAAEHDRREALARRRALPLSSELGVVLAYPFTDKVAFVLLGLFVGVFALAASLAGFGGGIGTFISQGLLYAYAFSAINRVSSGNLSGFMPQLDDWTDLVQPLRAGLAALLVSSGPLLALTFVFGWQDVAEAVGAGRVATIVQAEPSPSPSPTVDPALAALLAQDEDDEGDSPGSPERAAGGGEPPDAAAEPDEPVEPVEPVVPGWALAAFALAILWKVVYSPIALVAAAISQSFVATLNPLAGLDAIRRMGATYWSAMGYYTVIVLLAGLAGLGLHQVPMAGRLLSAFVDAYSFLAIGCLLGLAVFKKAPELDLQ